MRRIIARLALLVMLACLVACAPTSRTPTPLPAATQTPLKAATAIPAATPTVAPANTPTPAGGLDLAPFKKMASASACSDIRNRLFLIDGSLVFWDLAGNCSDASYAQILYGSTPDQMLCRLNDSIAGPMRTCWDARYQDMFTTITANRTQPDLGLGPQHIVQAVTF